MELEVDRDSIIEWCYPAAVLVEMVSVVGATSLGMSPFVDGDLMTVEQDPTERDDLAALHEEFAKHASFAGCCSSHPHQTTIMRFR